MSIEVYIGKDNTVKIKLAEDPQGTATVELQPRNINRLLIKAGGTLTFTSANWNVEQDATAFIFPNVDDGALVTVYYKVTTSWGGIKDGQFDLTANTVGAVDLSFTSPYLGYHKASTWPSGNEFTVLGRVTALDVAPTDTSIRVLVSNDIYDTLGRGVWYVFVNETNGTYEAINYNSSGGLSVVEGATLNLSSQGANDSWLVWCGFYARNYTVQPSDGAGTHRISTRSGGDFTLSHNTDTQADCSTIGAQGIFGSNPGFIYGPTATVPPGPGSVGEAQVFSDRITNHYQVQFRRSNLTMTAALGFTENEYDVSLGSGKYYNYEATFPQILDQDATLRYWGYNNGSSIGATDILADFASNFSYTYPDYEDYSPKPPGLVSSKQLSPGLDLVGPIEFQ